jgi:hypothetical protein
VRIGKQQDPILLRLIALELGSIHMEVIAGKKLEETFFKFPIHVRNGKDLPSEGGSP